MQLLIAASALALTACGGGGEGGASSASGFGNSSTAGSQATYTIGGTVSGLSAPLVLMDNGNDTVTLGSGASSFTFPTAVAAGGTYSVTVQSQPTGQTCSVSNGSGTANGNVSAVSVDCISLALQPSSELLALAQAYVGLQATSALADLALITSGATPCAAGGAASVNATTNVANYSNCSTEFVPANAYSGSLSAGQLGAFPSTTSGFLANIKAYDVTVINSAPLGSSMHFVGGTFTSTEGLTGQTLSGALAAASALTVDIGKGSTYVFSAVALGSPAQFSRQVSGGVVTNSFPAAGFSVSLNGGSNLTVLNQGTIVWQGSGYPTAGGLGLSNSSGMLLTVNFSNSGQFTITGVSNKQTINETKSWTDSDVQAAIRYVTQ